MYRSMIIRRGSLRRGFTVVEIIIVIVVIAILAAIGTASYNGIQKSAAKVVVMSVIRDAQKSVDIENVRGGGGLPNAIPDSFQSSSDVDVAYIKVTGNRYKDLSAVQNGVLFHQVCVSLAANPYYSVIHSKDGNNTSTVVMSCDDNVRAGGMQITGWETKNWDTPVTQQLLEEYIASVPYDSWWTDRQEVVRGFYTALISEFTSQGGTWPVTSFWDPWANPWAGVHKEELPAPTSSESGYCIVATHKKYLDVQYSIRINQGSPQEGGC